LTPRTSAQASSRGSAPPADAAVARPTAISADSHQRSGTQSEAQKRSPPRLSLLNIARVILLGGPTALAFFAGGYFEGPRLWAGLVAWILVVAALLAGENPLSRSGPVLLALLGLALFAAWSLLSIIWAPVAGDALHVGQRLVLYVGMLFAAVTLLRTRGAQRAVEPALAAGTLLVIGYGISGRLLPGLLHFQRSVSAQGRLEQPLTYWNGMGEVAALGIVLAVRIAGDATRAPRLRVAAAAATAPLGLGLYLTFSRGALFACAAGLVALIVVAPSRAQVQALLLSVCAGVAAALSAAPYGGVTSLTGDLATRERQGVITLALLAATVAATALAQWRLMRRKQTGELRLPRRAPLIALGLVCAGLALAAVSGAKETSTQPLAPGATRLVTLQSDRYAYWRVALHVFAQEPLHGVGAGAWSVSWLRLRPFHVGAQDAHSLPIQTAAELGLVGLALLAAFLVGVAVAAGRAHRVAPALSAGPLAGFVVYVAHAPLDWDWEMPAVTLVALVLAGLLLALGDYVEPGRDHRDVGVQRTSERVAA
jgi:O-Antigen ligase